MISEEELRTIIENLDTREIIEPALDNWIPYESTGITLINLYTGIIKGVSVKFNEITDFNSKESYKEEYIEIYKIEAEKIIEEYELLNDKEYDKYEDFREEKDISSIDYTPDLFSEFCKIENIDEKERKIKLLIENFEEYNMNNYQDFEHSIILNYYDEDDYTY
ncbi:MAG: hypothetical protein MJ232_02345 [archaeon]|nr:hypothetical protein [archaeon]